jgi:GMP synthase-like glutamine amidotransferase
MRAHTFQHVPFEGLGSIEPWLLSHGFELTYTRFYESSALPDPNEIDLLIIMGGPMSVNDEGTFPWLKLEKQFVREMVSLGKPILGICLGAQLIASALGANVYANPMKEIGWFTIHAQTSNNHDCAFRFPASETVFHWHGETFDLPPGAIRLARSEACLNQAFQIGERIIGLQFHLETTTALAQALVSHCADELIPAKYVQSADAILSAPGSRYQSINTLMDRILNFLLAAG